MMSKTKLILILAAVFAMTLATTASAQTCVDDNPVVTVATIVAMAFIFAFLTLRTRSEQALAGRALYLEIEFEPGDRPDDVLRSLIDLMKPTLQTVNLRRFDTGDSGLLASFSVSCDRSDQVGMTAAAIRREWPSARVTFLDQDHIPGV